MPSARPWLPLRRDPAVRSLFGDAHLQGDFHEGFTCRSVQAAVVFLPENHGPFRNPEGAICCGVAQKAFEWFDGVQWMATISLPLPCHPRCPGKGREAEPTFIECLTYVWPTIPRQTMLRYRSLKNSHCVSQGPILAAGAVMALKGTWSEEGQLRKRTERFVMDVCGSVIAVPCGEGSAVCHTLAHLVRGRPANEGL